MSENILSHDFKYSQIRRCIIEKDGIIISKSKKYNKILFDIWDFNFESTEQSDYQFYDYLNMLYQTKDANVVLKEILRFIKKYNLNYEIEISLKNKDKYIFRK